MFVLNESRRALRDGGIQREPLRVPQGAISPAVQAQALRVRSI